MLVRWGEERGAVPYIGSGKQRWPFVHVRDLAALYARALEDAPAGTLLHAADGPAYAMKEIAQAASFAADVPGKTEPWPLEEARAALGGFADALALDQQISAHRARELLGWQPMSASVLDDLKHGSYVF